MTVSATLVLASSSPRRREILERLGLFPEIRFPDIEEKRRSGESPAEFALRTAREKAHSVARQISPESRARSWIIGADTVVVADGDAPLGKPRDDGQAREMLEALSGREHRVLTGWVVVNPGNGQESAGVELTRVWFKKLRREEIDAYVASGEGSDKAGAYGIQGVGCFMIERIEGNYENVVGLPACPVVEALLALGVLSQFPRLSDSEGGA